MSHINRKSISAMLALIIFLSGFSAMQPVQAQGNLSIDSITINTDLPSVNGSAQTEIKWRTSQSAYGRLRYGTSASDLAYIITTSGIPQTEYKTTLSGLKSETTYYFVIEAQINTEVVTSFNRSFKTKKVVSTEVPEFDKNISVVDVTGRTATFQWTTDAETSGTVFYGTNKTKLSSSASQSGRSKEHEVVIKNLQPATTYYYQAQIKDKDGNLANYYIDSFRTLDTDTKDKESLNLTGLTPNDTNDPDVKTDSLTIRFTTNHPTKATINLRAKNFTRTIKTGTFSTTLHNYAVTGLTPNTTYNATIEITDVTGHNLKLENLTFATKDLAVAAKTVSTAVRSNFITPAVRLIKTADRDTVYALVSSQPAGNICAASVSNINQAGWKAEYFDYDKSLTGMDAALNSPTSASPLDTGWYASQYLVKTQIDDNLKFGNNFFPLDYLKAAADTHNYYFGVHWTGYVTVNQTGDFAYTLSSDDDSWILVDGQVVKNNGGIHGSKQINDKLRLTAGKHQLDIYYADRKPVQAAMNFAFKDDKLTITTGNQTISCPANQIKTATVKLHAIMTPEAFKNYGYQWNKIEIVSAAELARFQPVVLARTADNPTVYYLDTARRLKIAIPNEAIFNSYGNQWSDVIYVVPEDLKAYFDVELVKEPGSPVVYKIKDNTLRPFTSEKAFTGQGYSFQQVLTINSYHLSYFSRGDAIQ